MDEITPKKLNESIANTTNETTNDKVKSNKISSKNDINVVPKDYETKLINTNENTDMKTPTISIDNAIKDESNISDDQKSNVTDDKSNASDDDKSNVNDDEIKVRVKTNNKLGANNDEIKSKEKLIMKKDNNEQQQIATSIMTITKTSPIEKELPLKKELLLKNFL